MRCARTVRKVCRFGINGIVMWDFFGYKKRKLRKLSDTFLWTAKALYGEGVHPFDFDKEREEAYERIVGAGVQLIMYKGIEYFAGFVMEYPYRVNVWTAFIVLEYGNPSPNQVLQITKKDTIVEHCLKIVKSNETPPLSERINRNKKEWINKMELKYGIPVS